MQANTLQVRSVMRNAIKLHNAHGFGTSYTEKTSAKHTARRSVVFGLWQFKAADVLATVQAEFAKLGYTNKVKVTGGGDYLRCIADIA